MRVQGEAALRPYKIPRFDRQLKVVDGLVDDRSKEMRYARTRIDSSRVSEWNAEETEPSDTDGSRTGLFARSD